MAELVWYLEYNKTFSAPVLKIKVYVWAGLTDSYIRERKCFAIQTGSVASLLAKMPQSDAFRKETTDCLFK